MALISISGWIGCGKDTAADYLIKNHNFIRDSFAQSLKDATAAIFSWDREMIEGKTPESRIEREEVDEWWANKLGIPNFSPRLAMQLLGTETLRNTFNRNIWVYSLESRIRNANDKDVVITDCRFRNELATVKSLNGKSVWVRRGSLPSWYDIAISANQGCNNAVEQLLTKGIHESEWSWVGYDFDYIIVNDGNLADLYNKVEEVLIDINK
jgi:hypothetical protein